MPLPVPAFSSPGDDRLRAVLESALDCIICMDKAGLVQEFNPAAERTFGFTRAEAIGRELAELIIPPELREAHRRGLAHYLAAGEGPVLGRRIEVPGQRADGSRLLVELAITVTRADDVPFFTAYLRDITEQRRAEQRRTAQYAVARLLSGARALSEIGGEVLAVIASISDWAFGSIWLQSADGATLENVGVWHSAEKRYGAFEETTRRSVFRPGAGLPGKVLLSGQPAWVRDVTADPTYRRHAIAAREGLRGAFAFALTSGARVFGVIEMLSPRQLDPDDDLLRIAAALGSNIGQFLEREHAEQQLHEQKKAAEAANAAKDRFLAAVSHELRTPLTPVLLWSQSALGDPAFPAEWRHDLALVHRNVELEARLIDDLLDFSGIGQGKIRFEKAPVDLHTILGFSLETVRDECESCGLSFDLDLAALRPCVIGDPVRLQQVFWNLLRNACKFTPRGGRITLRTWEEEAGGTICVEVRDTGKGIPVGELALIFNPFEQAGSEGFGGLGLGLAISKTLVEKHGGRISADSSGQGQGATFHVRLPLAPKGTAIAPPPSAPPIPPAPARALRILLVEDHEHTAVLMARLLQRAGHQVTVTRSVRAAAEAMETGDFEVVVSDLGLPDGSGLEVIAAARARHPRIAGIALSGYGQEEDLRKSLAAGFGAHLTKPVDVEQLKRTIAELTAEPPAQPT